MGRIATQTADATVKAINTVAEEDRPAAVVSNVIVRRERTPHIGHALKSLVSGNWDKTGFERDISAASRDLWQIKDQEPNSIHWWRDRGEAIDVLDHMNDRSATKHLERLDRAYKAMDESGSYALTGGTAGGILVPPEFRQDMFADALVANVAVRRAGVTVVPVTSNNIRLPREATAAGASQQSEAGQLSPTDAVFAQQSLTIEKQYGYRLFSNELMADAEPPFMAWIARTVARDLAIQQDIQFLRGTGSTPQITGITAFSNTTTGPSLGTNGRTPTWDDILDADYLLQDANSQGTAFIAHPRVIHSLRKSKAGDGKYLVDPNALSGAAMGANGRDVTLLGYLPAYTTTNLLRTQSVGSSNDCTTAIMFDRDQMAIFERQGIELAVSRDIKFDYDQTAVRAIARSVIATLQPASVLLITGIRP